MFGRATITLGIGPHSSWVGFWGTFAPNNVTHHPNPKRTVLGPNHVIWAIKREYWPNGSSWAFKEEKRTGQEKVTKGLNFNVLGRNPHSSELHQKSYCVVLNIQDIITCAKFQNEIFRGYHFTGGRIFHFPIDIWMGLTTMQRYCATCDNSLYYRTSRYTWTERLLTGSIERSTKRRLLQLLKGRIWGFSPCSGTRCTMGVKFGMQEGKRL